MSVAQTNTKSNAAASLMDAGRSSGAESARKPSAPAAAPKNAAQPGRFAAELERQDSPQTRPEVPAAPRKRVPVSTDGSVSSEKLPTDKKVGDKIKSAGMQASAELAGAAALVNSGMPLPTSPLLSILTGKLDQVQPEAIPEIVSGSTFVNAAMTAPDMISFMDTPAPVATLLEGLGIDSASLPRDNIALTAQDMSPRALLRSLGIDSSRVSAELEQMKDALPLDGFAPYVQRAKAMQALNQISGQSISTLETANKQRPDSNSIMTERAPTEKMQSQQPLATSNRDPRTTGVTSGGGKLPKAIDIEIPRQMSQVQTSNSLTNSQIVPQGANSFQPISLENINADNGVPLNSLLSNDVESSEVGLPKLEPVVENSDSLIVSADTVRIDQFDREFAQFMDVQPQDLTFQQSATPLQTDLLNPSPTNISFENSIREDLQRVLADRRGMNEVRPLETKSMVEDSSLVVPQTDSTLRIGQEGVVGQKSMAMNPSEALLARSIQGSFAKDFSQDMAGGDGESSLEKDFTEELSFTESGADLKAPMDQVGFGQSLNNNVGEMVLDKPDTKSLKVADSADVASHIREKAFEAIKNAGGSASSSLVIDIGTPELGKLEVAIDVQKDSVGLKVLAASDHAKEIFASEIGRLKEALNSQNLDLRNFDLGSRERQQFAQSQGNMSQQQGWQGEFGARASAGFKPNSINKYGKLDSKMGAIAAMRNLSHAGSIQVLA